MERCITAQFTFKIVFTNTARSTNDRYREKNGLYMFQFKWSCGLLLKTARILKYVEQY